MGCGCGKKAVAKQKPDMKVISDRRMTICRRNKCGKYSKFLARCKECGCFLKLKTYINSEECPLGYW